MAASSSDGPTGCPEFVSRRRLLELAGAAGMAATVSACTNRTGRETTGEVTTSSSPLHSTAQSAAAGPETGPSLSPTPEPIAPQAPALVATSGVLLCRDAWKARPARAGGIPHIITRMTIHHTAVVLGDNSNITDRLRRHQRYHQDEKGWIDIAYHVGVDRNGNIFELRTTDLAGDTATSYDPAGHFLVVCEGDFDQEAVTDAQLDGAARAFAWAAQRFTIATDTLAGHRDVADTSCPGANLYAEVSSGGLQRRIESLLSTGAVDLQTVCGPDAAAIASDIEAGL